MSAQTAAAPVATPPRASSPGRDLLRALRRNRLAATGAVLLGIVLCCAAFAPTIAPRDPNLIRPEIRLEAPSSQHWFGTDSFGRDMFSRVVYGSRVSLLIGALVVFFSTVAGVLFGMLAGYFRTWDSIVMRIMDALLAIPPVLLAIAIVASLGPRISNVVISLTVAYTPQLARVLRAQVLVLREATFTEAAKSEGAHDLLIAFRHVLPNALSPIIVQGTATLAYAVLTEAALSFLGVGAPPYIPSWGNELNDGRLYMVQAPWITLFPGLAIMICVLGLNLFGDGLRDVLDPRLRQR